MYYKYEDELLLSGNCLSFPDGEYLDESSASDLVYPYQGWYWFPNDEEAKLFFGIE